MLTTKLDLLDAYFHIPILFGFQEISPNKTLVLTESEEFPLLLFSVIKIELLRTEDGTSPCLRSET
jgi:hypothetical protein